MSWNATACAGVGAWLSTLPKSGDSPAFTIDTDNSKSGRVRSILVWSPEIVTPSGLHVGSTEAEVAAALPKSPVHTGPIGESWYSVTSGGSRITFTMTVTDDSSPKTVYFILVLPSRQEDLSYYATDAVGGPCSNF